MCGRVDVSMPWAELTFSEPWAEEQCIAERPIWSHISCPGGGVAVDVGANQGFYTTKLAKEASLVLAFEPHPLNYSFLCFNLKRNKIENVIPFQVALSDIDGLGTLYAYDVEVYKDSVKSFLADISVPPPQRAIPVVVKTLDSFSSLITHLNLIKIDVEGAELKVIKGAEKTLQKHGPKIVCETHFDQGETVRQRLQALGYRCTHEIVLHDNHFGVFER